MKDYKALKLQQLYRESVEHVRLCVKLGSDIDDANELQARFLRTFAEVENENK